MTRSQILRKKAGKVLAVVGIILSFLPAVRMPDGSKLFIFQLIGNEAVFGKEVIAETPGFFGFGVFLTTILIYGLLVHILNLILWIRKTEKTYIGVMGFSFASFLGLLGTLVMSTFWSTDGGYVFPITIWQCFRILIVLCEVIIKLHGEEFFDVFFPEK